MSLRSRRTGPLLEIESDRVCGGDLRKDEVLDVGDGFRRRFLRERRVGQPVSTRFRHENFDVTDDRTRWNEKYSGDDDFELPVDPIPELERRIDTLPAGRALDVATGTGRNAIYLAEHGYDVEAVDVSDEALKQAKHRADERGVDVEWIRADLTDTEFDVETDTYDLITVSFFAALDLLPDLKEALAPGGVLVYEHHLRSSDAVEIGPSSKRHRYRSNDLLRACLDLTILSYEERRRTVNGGSAAVTTLVARNSDGGTQSYPDLP
ncbi:MAG: class I SAM-dependent methyltransferase [Natronomonas sp.]